MTEKRDIYTIEETGVGAVQYFDIVAETGDKVGKAVIFPWGSHYCSYSLLTYSDEQGQAAIHNSAKEALEEVEYRIYDEMDGDEINIKMLKKEKKND